VLVAEDQAIVRAGFRALLDAEPDLEVAGKPPTAARLWRLLASFAQTSC